MVDSWIVRLRLKQEIMFNIQGYFITPQVIQNDSLCKGADTGGDYASNCKRSL
jgi:hypothetical protein